MDNYQQHITIEGQRWDQVAQEYYGAQTIQVNGVNRSSVGYLIENNPDIPTYDVFPGGIVLNIPIVDKSEVLIEAEKLPPWKQ